MANFKYRTQSTQRYAGTTAGFYCDLIHVSGAVTNKAITPSAGYVLQAMIVNTVPASGVLQLRLGSDVIATIAAANAGRDFKYNSYLSDQLYFSSDDGATDVTFIVTKGFAGTA